MTERGMLQTSDRLQEVITRLMIASPIDTIVVPEGTEIESMAWKFNHKQEPTVIMECSKFELLEIVATLAKTISQLQAKEKAGTEHGTVKFSGVKQNGESTI